jgi:hypothetical protein
LTRVPLVVALAAGALLAASAPASLESGIAWADQSLSHDDALILAVCEGVVHLFEQDADEIWPGYDLSRQPFMVYVPDRWALLFSCGADTGGFGPPPPSWPDLGVRVCYREGQLGNLVGQRAFGYEAGGTKTVAVGFQEPFPEPLDDIELKMFGYIVHEAFHQYQDGAFGEIEWAREQLYPTDDAENAALAYLEMALLKEAILAGSEGDPERAKSATSQFVAVRALRWGRGDEYLPVYEGGMEVREGTARYVELRCLDLARQLDYVSAVPGPPPLTVALAAGALPGSLLEDLARSMADDAVPVEDMPRNRIYPVACAQGYLLDFFGVDCKALAEQETPDFRYARLLADRLGLTEEDYPALADEAKAAHDYTSLVAAARRVIGEHLDEYAAAMEAFDGQTGRRIEITFDSNGLYRSRYSSATKLVVDRGAREYCDHYDVYTLERDGTFFELHDAALLEENDYDGRIKTIVFYAPSIDQAVLSGEPLADKGALAGTADAAVLPGRELSSIELSGDGFELKHDGPCTIEADEDAVRIDLNVR